MKLRLEALGVKVTITSDPKGKSPIERLWETFQTVELQRSKHYYGEGIQSRRTYAHRSDEYITRVKAEAKKEGWDFDHAWRETEQQLEAFRDRKYSEYSTVRRRIEKSPRQLRLESDTPNVRKITEQEWVSVFGCQTVATIRNEWIQLTIGEKKYWYRPDPVTVIHYTGVQLTIQYDIDDLEQVYLYDSRKDEVLPKFICLAPRQKEVERYGPDADFSGMGTAKQHIKAVEEARKAVVADLTNTTYDATMYDGTGYEGKEMEDEKEAAFLESKSPTLSLPEGEEMLSGEKAGVKKVESRKVLSKESVLEQEKERERERKRLAESNARDLINGSRRLPQVDESVEEEGDGDAWLRDKSRVRGMY
jgi:hypothetical protein